MRHIFGRGLGNGVQKLGYLPEDTTDFIFAVICEELGIFGALLTAALYLGIAFVAWQVIRQRRDSFGRMLAFGRKEKLVALQPEQYIAVQTYVVLIAIFYIVLNFLVDVLYTVLDPRIRHARAVA